MDKERNYDWAHRPIINCHTHIFTGDYVPPHLGKTLVPWPLYYLVNLQWVISLARSWYYGRLRKLRFIYYRQLIPIFLEARKRVLRSPTGKAIYSILEFFLVLHSVYFILKGFSAIPYEGDRKTRIGWLFNQIYDHLVWKTAPLAVKVFTVLLVLIFFPTGRNLLYFVFKKTFKFLSTLPGPATQSLLKRYLLLGRFAFFRSQLAVFGKLKAQYPPGTGFIVLPMDMEYMEAGALKNGFDFNRQMAELASLKQRKKYHNIFYPFIFIDPRRIRDQGKTFFDWHFNKVTGKIVLNECMIKKYIEEEKFSGFKIYPALGYFPFDELLLPLWYYAAQEQLPIMTHCIRGTIYYRGEKKEEWDFHKVFNEPGEKDTKLRLPEIENNKYTAHFTHPMNYLCLLDKTLLVKLVRNAPAEVKALFGFTEDSPVLLRTLEDLKICFAHYGGDDEWYKFIESDRDIFSPAIVSNPSLGINFTQNRQRAFSDFKIAQLWRQTDWYSIITSLMLQYKGVYSDVSYIIHNREIVSLLKQTLGNGNLTSKVLFGTDFYVVRNHKTEKSMLSDLIANFTESEIEAIAKCNTRCFLTNNLHGVPAI